MRIKNNRIQRFFQKLLAVVLAASLGLGILPPSRTESVLADETAALSVEKNFFDMNTKTLTVKMQAATGTAIQLIAAAYQDGVMKESVYASASGTQDVSFTFSEVLNDFKVFAVDPETLEPLCQNLTLRRPLDDSEVKEYKDTVELPVMPNNMGICSGAVLRDYVAATELFEQVELLAEQPSKFNAIYQDATKYAEAMALVNKTMETYQTVLREAAVMNAVAEMEAVRETTRLTATKKEMLSSACYGDPTQEEQLRWAQQITQQWDSIQGNKKLATFAEQIGYDARTAFNALSAAQDILRGKYLADAQTAETLEKVCLGVKMASKVGLYVGGAILTGGASGMVTVAEGVGLVLGGVDTAIEVAEDTSKIILGPDNPNVDKVFDSKPMKVVKGTLFVYGVVSGTAGWSDAKAYEKIALIGDVREKSVEKLDEMNCYYDAEGKLVAEVIELGLTAPDGNATPQEVRDYFYNKYGYKFAGKPDNWQEVVTGLTGTVSVTQEDIMKVLTEDDLIKSENDTDGLKKIEDDFDTEINKAHGWIDVVDPPEGADPEARKTIPETRMYTLNPEDRTVGMYTIYQYDKLYKECFYSEDPAVGNHGLLWEKEYFTPSVSYDGGEHITFTGPTRLSKQTEYTSLNENEYLEDVTKYFEAAGVPEGTKQKHSVTRINRESGEKTLIEEETYYSNGVLSSKKQIMNGQLTCEYWDSQEHQTKKEIYFDETEWYPQETFEWYVKGSNSETSEDQEACQQIDSTGHLKYHYVYPDAQSGMNGDYELLEYWHICWWWYDEPQHTIKAYGYRHYESTETTNMETVGYEGVKRSDGGVIGE